MVRGLSFVDDIPVVASDPHRADIACFVGFVAQRRASAGGEVMRWLAARGWPTQTTVPPVEATARDALPASLTLVAPANRLTVTLDGRTQTLVLPVEPMTPTRLVQTLNSLMAGGYAYTDGQGRLVLGSDTQGVRASVQVRRNPALGFALDTLVAGETLRITTIPDLTNLPIPIDTWDMFDQLFAWEQRVFDAQGTTGHSYLGAAVRSFFAQGGRKCYVVRVGDPPLLEPAAGQTREDRLYTLMNQVIPGYPDRIEVDPLDQTTWKGVAHLLGLTDVSFVCLPDLPDLVSAARVAGELPAPLPGPEERFVVCSEPVAPPADREEVAIRAPRCDDDGYEAWARAVRLVGDMLARYQRETQLVAAIPLPEAGHAVQQHPLGALVANGEGPLAHHLNDRVTGMASAFVQLVYPWVKTAGSARLPERLEVPDAVVVGLLARNALARGTYQSAATLRLGDVYDVVPGLRRDQMQASVLDNPRRSAQSHILEERVTLLGPTPAGFRLLSDVTTSLDESYRLASVNRLIATLVRAARLLGETLVFEPSGPLLWRRLREQMEHLLRGLWRQGALRGDAPGDAFQVRCDRSTMTQQDLDQGRLIAEVTFTPTVSIEQIQVVLALAEGGQVSLVGGRRD